MKKPYILKVNSLKRGWCDRDQILLHASFQILIDFIEQERPDRHIDWSHDKIHKHAWREIETLYSWWKSKRPSRRNPLDRKGLMTPPFKIDHNGRMVQPDKKKYAAYYRALKEFLRFEKKWEAEDQQNLYRLIAIRRFLWT